MHILITGVAGFIGSHLAERLIREGHTVVGVDMFTDYYGRDIKERNLATLRLQPGFHFIEADLMDLDWVELLQRGSLDRAGSGSAAYDPIRYVFHLAAQPGVRHSWGDHFQDYTRNNILTTQRLLEAAKEVALSKFVYASSSSVYGDAEAFPTPENVIPRPISPYGVTKLAAEQLCLLYWRNYGVPVVCTRYFTVYGPRQRPDMAFQRFIHAIVNEQDIYIYGDGEQTRDFTFVRDAVEGTIRAAFSDVQGEVFNIGGGSRVTLNQVIDLLGDLLNRRVRRRYLAAQRGDARNTAAQIQHAARLLGYAPSIHLEDGLKYQIEWAGAVLLHPLPV